ncbi:hypothetical protein ABPG75_011564 [Micractinium tetrahymenae]
MVAACRRCAAQAAALLAFAVLAAAAVPRRSLAGADPAGWGKVTVTNSCPYAVAVKAGYVHDAELDKGHPCPDAVADADVKTLSKCATDWLIVGAGKAASLPELPNGLWQYSAYIPSSSPRYWLTHTDANLEAFLAPAWNFGAKCAEPEPVKGCVWWGVPSLNKAGDGIKVSCPGYSPDAAPAPAPALLDVTVVNNCSKPVQVKFAYQMAEGDKGEGCLFNDWYGDEHRCITDWQSFEPNEERFIGQTINPNWNYAARLADDPSVDLGAKAPGAFQGTNETLACPEKDVYGSGYVCEWWAPKCFFCELSVAANEPLVIDC